jgi:hypothetical protein
VLSTSRGAAPSTDGGRVWAAGVGAAVSEGSPEDFPSMRKDKPFFEGGRVETAVTQSKAGVARPTDQIMKEVQEEGEFARLVSQMRKTLHVQDRILGRIPYFNVRPPILPSEPPSRKHESSDRYCRVCTMVYTVSPTCG